MNEHAAEIASPPRTLKARVMGALPAGRFGRNVAVIAGGQAIGQVITIATAPLLTRLYSPEDYGVLAVWGGVLATLVGLAALRYDWTIPIPPDHRDAAALLMLTFWIIGGFSALVLVGAAVLWWSGVAFGWVQELRPYAWLLPVGVLGAALYQSLSVWIIRLQDLQPLARTRVTQAVTGAGVSLLGGVAGIGPIGLIVGHLTSQMAGIRLLGSRVWRDHSALLRSVRVADSVRVGRRHMRTALAACGSSFLNTAGLEWTPIVLAAYYGPREVGWFALSTRVVAVPIGLVGTSVAQAFWSEAARSVHEDPRRLDRQFRRAAKALTWVSVAVAGLGLASPFFLHYIFGAREWAGMGLYTLYLTPLFIAKVIVSPISHLMVHEKQHWQFVWDAARLAVMLTGFVVAAAHGWSADAAIIQYSVLGAALYAVLYGMNVHAIKLRIARFEHS
jgi:O-antigen/teichoic acid export membrane protein